MSVPTSPQRTPFDMASVGVESHGVTTSPHGKMLSNVVLVRDGEVKTAPGDGDALSAGSGSDETLEWHSWASNAQADQLAGTGVLFQNMPDGSFAITHAVKGSPAAAAVNSASLFIGDQLIAVDGWLLHGKSHEEVLSKIMGPAGTSVVITVLRSRACMRRGGAGACDSKRSTAAAVGVLPQSPVSEIGSIQGQVEPAPADDALVLAATKRLQRSSRLTEAGADKMAADVVTSLSFLHQHTGSSLRHCAEVAGADAKTDDQVAKQAHPIRTCADCAILKEQVKVLTQGLTAALKNKSHKRDKQAQDLDENNQMMLEALQRRIESRDQTIAQLEQQLLSHEESAEEMAKMVLQIKQQLTENADLKMGLEEAYSVIESLENTIVSLKSQLSNLEETRSKADVVSLHNDKIFVLLNAVSLERDEALNMRAVVDARNQRLSRELDLQRDHRARERAEGDRERAENLEQIRSLQTELQQLVAQLKVRQGSSASVTVAEKMHCETPTQLGQERACLQAANDATSHQPPCNQQAEQMREHETRGSNSEEEVCSRPGDVAGGNQAQAQAEHIVMFRCDRNQVDATWQQKSQNVSLVQEVTSFSSTNASGDDSIRSATEGDNDNFAGGVKKKEKGMRDVDVGGAGGAEDGGGGDEGSFGWSDASVVLQANDIHGSDKMQLVMRLRDELAFQTQSNKDLQAQLDHSQMTIQTLNSRMRSFHQDQSSRSLDETFAGGGHRMPVNFYALDLSMHEMLLAERENTQFLSRSLSQLSRTHSHELLKLESTRSHCEELAIELNERLVQKEAEIILLRQQLAASSVQVSTAAAVPANAATRQHDETEEHNSFVSSPADF